MKRNKRRQEAFEALLANSILKMQEGYVTGVASVLLQAIREEQTDPRIINNRLVDFCNAEEATIFLQNWDPPVGSWVH